MTNKSSGRVRKPSAKKAGIDLQNIPEQGKPNSSQTFATVIETAIPKLNEICPCEVTDKDKSLPFIQCDKCNQWWHTKCAGISKAEAEKLDKLNIKYCCVFCVVKSISKQQVRINKKLVDVLLEDSSKVKQCRGEVKSPKELIPEIESEASEDKQRIVEGNNNTERVIITEEGTGKFSKVKEVQKDKEVENIVIIDNITNPKEFTDSRKIFKEIRKVDETTKIKYAYSLQRGGIAIHIEKPDEKENLVNNLKKSIFCNSRIYALEDKTHTIFLKNVPLQAAESEIAEQLSKANIRTKVLTRLTWKKTGRPLPVVKIVLQKQEAEKLLQTKILIRNQDCIVEPKKRTNLRCYNCQSFGHIAANCKKISKRSARNESDPIKHPQPEHIHQSTGTVDTEEKSRHNTPARSMATQEAGNCKGLSGTNHEAETRK